MNEVSREINCLRDKQLQGLFIPEFPVPETVPGNKGSVALLKSPFCKMTVSSDSWGLALGAAAVLTRLFRRWELRTLFRGTGKRSAVVGPRLLVPPPLLSVHASVFLPQQHRSAWTFLILCYFSLPSFLPTLTLFFPFHPAWLAAKLVYNYVFILY